MKIPTVISQDLAWFTGILQDKIPSQEIPELDSGIFQDKILPQEIPELDSGIFQDKILPQEIPELDSGIFQDKILWYLSQEIPWDFPR